MAKTQKFQRGPAPDAMKPAMMGPMTGPRRGPTAKIAKVRGTSLIQKDIQLL